ncbi:hypothetical protein DEV91_1362 [Phyllobacterium brassicacearum]|nr:hypothetical protein DEV91_1362 [Phyllobacterium brassicacearum]
MLLTNGIRPFLGCLGGDGNEGKERPKPLPFFANRHERCSLT